MLVPMSSSMDYKHQSNKHVVQDKARFMAFHYYPVGSWTIALGNNSKEDVLEIETH